ncbi:MAG: hypothetical protein LAT53_06455 [Idiomarina sp.]|nr:hypothetical protein [Idiomarina sp.]
MPYCHTVFHVTSPEQIENVLSTLTRESFVRGKAAYHLANDVYSIDAGENDIRAIYDKEKEVIRFFCRYQRDIAFYEKKLQTFAIKNNIDIRPQ